MAQKKISGDQVKINVGDLDDVDVAGGAEGDVLTLVAGEWVSAAPNAGSQPDTQVVFGTGAGVSSSDNFTFDQATYTLLVNQAILANDGTGTGEVNLSSGFNSFGGGQSNLTLAAPNTGSSNVFLSAGDSSDSGGGDDGFGGSIEIVSGDGTAADGGSILILSGDGINSGQILIRTGVADSGDSGNISLRVQSGDSGAGAIQLEAGNCTGGPGGFIQLQAGNSTFSAGTDAGGEVSITAGDTNSTTTGLGGDVRIKAGRNLVTAANSGSISLNTNNQDRLKIDVNGTFIVNGVAGAQGEVLTSDGAGGTAYWGPGGSGGGNRVHTYSLFANNNWDFSGNMQGTWAIGSPHNPPSPGIVQVSGDYSDEFEFLEGGVFRITIAAKISTSIELPAELSAYGIELVQNGGSVFTQNPSYHHIYGTATYPNGHFAGLGFAPSPAGGASNQFSWTDVFVIQATSGVYFKPYVYAYNYTSLTDTYSVNMIMMIEKISDDEGV